MQPNSDVYLLKQETYNLQQLTKNFKNLITQNKLNIENKIIVINPDLSFPVAENNLASTHPILLGALARALKFLGAYKVKILGNFPLVPARVGFLALGTSAYTMGYAEEIYLDETTYTKHHNKNPITNEEFNIPKILLDADLYFSVTKLRTDLFFKVNSSVVNSIKLLPYNEQNLILKENTYQKLFDLFCIRIPDFCIVDGIESAEGQSPWAPQKKDTKIIVAGKNTLDVDFICQQIIGINQDEISYLKIFNDKFNYLPALAKINIINKNLLVNNNFLLPKNLMQNKDNYNNFNFMLNENTENICENCIKALTGLCDVSKKENINLSEYTFITGNSFKDANIEKIQQKENKIILFGDCAQELKGKLKNSEIISGCPPDIFYASYKINKYLKKSFFKLNLSSLLFGYLGYFQNKLKLKKYPPYQKKEILPLLSAIKTYCH